MTTLEPFLEHKSVVHEVELVEVQHSFKQEDFFMEKS